MEQLEWIVSHLNGRLVLVMPLQGRRWALRVGDVFEVWAGDAWQRVTFRSGGYRGRYIETRDGVRARLALCTRARLLASSGERRGA